MSTNFVRPPNFKMKIPDNNPFDESEDKTPFNLSRWWKCLWKSCDPINWENLVQKQLDYYKSILITKDNIQYVAKGTKLYHGSTTDPFLGGNPTTNRITFFGLDVDIALWYILEQTYGWDNSYWTSPNGYLYEFVLIEDLPITMIISTLNKYVFSISMSSKIIFLLL